MRFFACDQLPGAWNRPHHRTLGAIVPAVQIHEHEEDVQHESNKVLSLRFSATKAYENHAIVKFLESIGAPFGACQMLVSSFFLFVILTSFQHSKKPDQPSE